MKQKTITKQQLIHENDELRLQIDQLKAAQQHNIEIEKALSRRDKILEATGYLADHILKTGNLDQGLQKGLQCLGDSTGVSRVYIFQNSTDIDGLLLMSQSYEWASPNTNSLIDNPTLQNVPYATDTRRAKMKDLLSKGNVYSGQTPFFSEEERSSLESQSILAIAVFPIFVENKWWGFIGFDDCETPRIWSPAEIGALKIAAGTIGSAIQREKAQKALLREQFNLEVKVRERTSLLTNVNLQLQQEIEEKKEIETRLQKNKEWLDLALSASNTGLWDWDVKTGKVVANEWYYSMLGLNPDMDPHSFKFFESLLHPNDRDKTIRSINRHIEKNRSGYELEFRLRTKTGNWIWVLDKGKVVERDAIGNPLRVVGTHSNITIRREIEEALRKSEERFQLALEAANDGIWDWNVTTGKVFANPSYYTMLGFSPELNPSSFDEFETWIHPEERERIVSTIQSSIRSKKGRYELEFRMGSAIEGWHWILDKAKVVERDAAGSPLRVVGTHSNITIRREIEEALRKSEERFQLALEAANDGIWDWNVTTGKVFANPSYYTMLGFSPELNPSSFDEFETWIHPEERERIVSTIQSSIRSKKGRYELEFRMGSAIEGWHWILDKAKVVERDAAGNPLRVVGTHSNITHRKKTEEILNKRDHDLKINAQKLEDVNTALKVLLKNNEDDKKRLEDTILVNVKELIIPYIERLKNSTINGRQLSFVEILETNLNNIISPFLKNISLNYSTLTPREIQVANLVKEGKTTKEIAQAFSISTDAVDFHRKTLRTKLGLRNKKVNLRSYLLSLT
ncbi:MAG TPA: PAS domain-containing protein [Syntrophales bacterium]|nr:PAS domain-containing protein [Syntrophales bacterium]